MRAGGEENLMRAGFHGPLGIQRARYCSWEVPGCMGENAAHCKGTKEEQMQC